MGTGRDFVDTDVVRLFHPPERVSLVTFLTAAASTCLLSQTSCSRLLQAVAARRPAAVPTVLGQLITQRLDGHSLLFHSLLQRQNDRDQGFFVQLSELVIIGLW